MTPSITLRMTHALPPEHRDRLMRTAREVAFEPGARLFDEGGRAGRFWIVHEGRVALDTRIPGHHARVTETLGPGDLVGRSWLFEPYVWQLGAEARTPVRAYAFDRVAVRAMCDDDAEFGRATGRWAGRVLSHRLNEARARLVDLYGAHPSGGAR